MSKLSNEPAVIFSSWYPWSIEEKLPQYGIAGVYALAHLKVAPCGNANPLLRNVVYIGETCGQTLGKRLYQFNCSAFRGKNGHSGGWTYRSRFEDKLTSHLHFAMWSCDRMPQEVAPFYIRYVERSLLWQYVRKWGYPPLCNSK